MFGHTHVTTRRLLLALALTLVLAPLASAQRLRRQNPMDGGQGGFQIGMMTLDLADLNTALTAASLPTLKGQFLSIGGYGMGVRGRWLIGGEGHALIGNDPSNAGGTYTVQGTAAYGLFRLGYNMLSHESIDLYPTIGFGGGSVNVEIRGRSAPTFGQVLAAPGRSSRLSSGGMLLGVGLQGNLRIRFEDQRADSSEGGMMIGATLGYVNQPGTSEWKLDAVNSVAGGPEVRLQGLTALFSFGGWARAKPKR